MAKASPINFQQQVSGPNLGAASSVQAPVQPSAAAHSSSKAFLIGALGKAALGANEGYQLSKLEEEQEKTIQEYMDRRQETVEGVGIEAATLEGTIDSMLNKGAYESEVNPIVQQYEEKLNRYQKAVEQGVMSPEELSARVLKNTREAVNRMPGLYKELLAHSEKVLGMSGIENIAKLDAQRKSSMADDIGKLQKELRDEADKYRIPFDRFNTNYAQLQQDVNLSKNAIATSEAVDRAAAGDTRLTAIQAKQWVTENGGNVIIGDTARLTGTFAELFKNSPPSEFANLKQQMSQNVDMAKNRLIAAITQKGIANDPQVQEVIKRHTASLDSLAQGIVDLQSGADAATMMENLNKRIRAEQQYQFAKQFDTAALDAWSKIPLPVLEKFAVKRNEIGLMALTDSLMKYTLTSPALIEAHKTRTVDPSTPDSVAVTMSLAANPEEFGKAVSTMRGSLAALPPEEAIVVQDAFMKQLGDPANKENFAQLPTAAMEDVAGLVDDYIQKTAVGKNDELQKYKDRGVIIRSAVEKGVLTYSSDTNPRVAKEFNDKYAARFNRAMKAIANTHGITVEEAVKKTLNRYGESVYSRSGQDTGDIPKPIGTLPTNKGDPLTDIPDDILRNEIEFLKQNPSPTSKAVSLIIERELSGRQQR